jgi:hypothetical protein
MSRYCYTDEERTLNYVDRPKMKVFLECEPELSSLNEGDIIAKTKTPSITNEQVRALVHAARNWYKPGPLISTPSGAQPKDGIMYGYCYSGAGQNGTYTGYLRADGTENDQVWVSQWQTHSGGGDSGSGGPSYLIPAGFNIARNGKVPAGYRFDLSRIRQFEDRIYE